LDELRAAQLREECRVVISVNTLEVSLRFSCTEDEGQYTGILVTLEPK
jgi:hypothetical protein